MVEAIIALGSNLGDRAKNLKQSLSALGEYGRVTAISSVYETKPMYNEDQGWFLNAVVSLETELNPARLLEALQSIEKSMGRERGVRYGPRVIDLDIVFYDGLVVSEPGLEVPHPRLAERPFVLEPLREIRPDLVHPVLKVTVSELASSVRSEKGTVRKFVVSLGSDPSRPRPPSPPG
jgi:dihydroneopterin aldolase / 2-amino-4-hydroxy-6-hydroxymethyldihydropteridine diphosphokinase